MTSRAFFITLLGGLRLTRVAQMMGQVWQILNRGGGTGADRAPVFALHLRKELATEHPDRAGRIDAHSNLHAVNLEDEDLDVAANENALAGAAANN
jgi:hypothetical protein